jgi:hypothetical protein
VTRNGCGLRRSSNGLVASVAASLGRSILGLTPLEREDLLFSQVMSVGLAVAWLLLFSHDDRGTLAV